MQPVTPKDYTHTLGVDQAGVRPLRVRFCPECYSFTSVWRPSSEELAILNAGGVVSVSIFGGFHPPINIGTEPLP